MSFVTNRVNALNRNYKRGIELSFIIILLLIIAAFKFAPMKGKPQQIKQTDPDIFIIKVVDPSIQLPKPPPPPKPPVLIASSLSNEIEDIILPSTEINLDEKMPDVPEPPKPPFVQDEFVEFKYLESYPEPIGGMKAIAEKIRYTELARRAEIEGTVTIEALLDKSGNVIDAKVIKGIGGGLDEIALQAVKDTKFIPGKQRDKPVKVKMNIPIKFRLK
jgi:periplasmic protein TonB